MGRPARCFVWPGRTSEPSILLGTLIFPDLKNSACIVIRQDRLDDRLVRKRITPRNTHGIFRPERAFLYMKSILVTFHIICEIKVYCQSARRRPRPRTSNQAISFFYINPRRTTLAPCLSYIDPPNDLLTGRGRSRNRDHAAALLLEILHDTQLGGPVACPAHSQRKNPRHRRRNAPSNVRLNIHRAPVVSARDTYTCRSDSRYSAAPAFDITCRYCSSATRSHAVSKATGNKYIIFSWHFSKSQ